jgi:hypothetical protein
MGARLSILAGTCARQPVVVGLVRMLDDELLQCGGFLVELFAVGVRSARRLLPGRDGPVSSSICSIRSSSLSRRRA